MFRNICIRTGDSIQNAGPGDGVSEAVANFSKHFLKHNSLRPVKSGSDGMTAPSYLVTSKTNTRPSKTKPCLLLLRTLRSCFRSSRL